MNKKKLLLLKKIAIHSIAYTTSFIAGCKIATNLYVLDDTAKAITNKKIPSEIEKDFSYYYQIYKDSFPQYTEQFNKKYNEIKVYCTKYDRETLNELDYSKYNILNNQIFLKNNDDAAHELGHLLSSNIKTGNCGFKKINGGGEALNEGVTTLIESELFLDEPEQINNKTGYYMPLAYSRILWDLLPKEELIDIYYNDNKNIDDLIKLLKKYDVKEEDSKKLFVKMDEFNDIYLETEKNYNDYRNNKNETNQNKLNKMLEQYELTFNETNDQFLKICNILIAEKYNTCKTSEEYATLLSDILYYDKQFEYISNFIDYDYTNNPDYIKIEWIEEDIYLSLMVDDELDMIKYYEYKGLIKPEKTSYKSENDAKKTRIYSIR